MDIIRWTVAPKALTAPSVGMQPNRYLHID